MSVRGALQAWNQIFFAPQSPVPVSLFRILYGICVSATLLLLHSDWLNWYGVDSWISFASIIKIEPGIRLNLFSLFPQNDAWIETFFWFSLAFSVLLMLGLFTRLSSVITFLCLASLQQRNLLICNSGDTFLRVTGFFLIFAPAGAAFSLDRLLRLRAGKDDSALIPRSPWAQRMIQFELAILYFMSFCAKSNGAAWVDGTALFYVLNIHQLRRFPIPGWIEHPLILRLGSWLTLALEFSLGALIWFKELRYPLLLLGILFHLCLEYVLNVPMFQWDVLSAYVLFVDPQDVNRFFAWAKRLRDPSSPYVSNPLEETGS